MVLYYSSTGNSKHVALKLHEAFDGDFVDICDFEEPTSFDLEDGEILFLVTSNCLWGVSNRMEPLLRKNEFRNVGRIVVIMTCDGYLGGGDASVEKLFSEKGLLKPTVYSLVMVTNYSILYGMPPLDAQKRKLMHAENTLRNIIQGTQKPYHNNWLIRQPVSVARAQYEKSQITSPFIADSFRIHYRLCAKNCSFHAIEMKDGKSSWKLLKCDICLHCLHHCPVETINYGDSTRNRLRYAYNSSVEPSIT